MAQQSLCQHNEYHPLYSKEGFKPFTIRVFFKWIEKADEGATMTDIEDTMIGLAAANYEQTITNENTEFIENTVVDPIENDEVTEDVVEEKEAAFKISAEIKFEQIISLD